MMFEKGVLRTMSVQEGRNERKKKTVGELFPNLCALPDIVRVIRLKRVGWARHVACMRKT
jgi:hypothetical protein